jgi:hypothetical protein
MSAGRPHLKHKPQIPAIFSRSADDFAWQPTCPSWMRLFVTALSSLAPAISAKEFVVSELQRYFTRVVLVLSCVLIGVSPAIAQSESGLSIPADATAAVPAGISPRPSLTLPALQVTFGALQIMDVVSTRRALNAGLSEGNTVMRGVVDRPLAVAAVKVGATAATVFLVNRVARKNRAAAILTMVAINSAYSFVVVRNIRAVPQQ